MSNEFIESFGHNEEELNQLGKTELVLNFLHLFLMFPI